MTRDVVAVPERTVRLRVNGLVAAVWSCSPTALEELAVGRMVADGFLGTALDLKALRALPDEGGLLEVEAEVPAPLAAAALEEREHRARHGCGLRFYLDCRPDLIARSAAAAGATTAPDPSAFAALFRSLYDAAEAYRETGGLHTAALSDGERLLVAHEEVGRHNAVDKAIGGAVLAELSPATLGLVTTARISGEIAAKAARAGLAWVASRSVPTTLAVEVAAAARMPIVARAAGRDATVFAGP